MLILANGQNWKKEPFSTYGIFPHNSNNCAHSRANLVFFLLEPNHRNIATVRTTPIAHDGIEFLKGGLEECGHTWVATSSSRRASKRCAPYLKILGVSKKVLKKYLLEKISRALICFSKVPFKFRFKCIDWLCRIVCRIQRIAKNIAILWMSFCFFLVFF